MVMRLRIPAPHWESVSGSQDAKCLKFPGKREFDPWFDDMDEARHICNGTFDDRVCPIREQCLLFALVNNEHEGVFGGTLPEQRHDLRQRHKRKTRGPIPAQWRFEHVRSLTIVREEIAEREAEREARRSGGDQEEPDAAAGGYPEALAA